jgi:glutamine synthetase
VISATELTTLVDEGRVHTVVCAFSDAYGRMLGKRLDARFFLDHALDDGTHACDYLLTIDMEMEPVPGYEVASWDQGYGDMHLVPDLSTLRIADWSPGTAWVICNLRTTDDDRPIGVSPRQILQRQLERAGSQIPMGASELEFYIYADSYREAAESNYRDLSPAGWYIEDYHLLQGARVEPYVGAVRAALTNSGVPVESSKGEWGRGQHEINIAYCDVLQMADRHSLMKHAMKEIAEQQGISVTFMAKPHAGEAGSSCHLHLSMWESDRNLFADDQGEPSVVFRQFLAGWMTHTPELMAWYAPTINSYKRYQDGSWAPTALAWSRDNRTAGFRIVGHGDSLRIECRIPGADVNPYLVFAAALASGLDGIERQLEPPESFTGDAYQDRSLPLLPHSLEQAVEIFATSEFNRRTFGDAVVDHYAHFARTEISAFAAAVTDFEVGRYFEQI